MSLEEPELRFLFFHAFVCKTDLEFAGKFSDICMIVKITNQTDWFVLPLLKAAPDSSLEWIMKQMSALKVTL